MEITSEVLFFWLFYFASQMIVIFYEVDNVGESAFEVMRVSSDTGYFRKYFQVHNVSCLSLSDSMILWLYIW